MRCGRFARQGRCWLERKGWPHPGHCAPAYRPAAAAIDCRRLFALFSRSRVTPSVRFWSSLGTKIKIKKWRTFCSAAHTLFARFVQCKHVHARLQKPAPARSFNVLNGRQSSQRRSVTRQCIWMASLPCRTHNTLQLKATNFMSSS